MATIYKRKVSDTEFQLSQYVADSKVLYPIYYNYNINDTTEDQAKTTLQEKVESFVIPS